MDFEILSLPIYDSIMEEFISKSDYYEFCHILDDMSAMIESYDFFEEAVADPGGVRKQKIKNVISNTKSTTKGIAKVYGDITDAKGAMLKNEVSLVLKLAGLAARAFKFIVTNLSKIPLGAIKLIDGAAKIPQITRAKIKGNIMLYFTAKDIQSVYNASIIRRLNEFTAVATKLCKGESWTTFWTNAKKRIKLNFDKSDMDLCRQLNQLSNELNVLEFQKTEINMSDQNNVAMYLDPQNKKIKFTDIHGKRHEDSYLEAVKQLALDLESMKTNIEGLQTTFGAKYDNTVMNDNFLNLTKGAQKLIYEAMNSISNVLRLIGLFMTRVTADINTIDNVIKKCGNREIQNVVNKGKEKVKKSDETSDTQTA